MERQLTGSEGGFLSREYDVDSGVRRRERTRETRVLDHGGAAGDGRARPHSSVSTRPGQFHRWLRRVLRSSPHLKRYGQHQRIAELEGRLTCTACGNRSDNFGYRHSARSKYGISGNQSFWPELAVSRSPFQSHHAFPLPRGVLAMGGLKRSPAGLPRLTGLRGLPLLAIIAARRFLATLIASCRPMTAGVGRDQEFATI